MIDMAIVHTEDPFGEKGSVATPLTCSHLSVCSCRACVCGAPSRQRAILMARWAAELQRVEDGG